MAKVGRPRVDNPRKHVRQVFLDDSQRDVLETLRTRMLECGETEISSSEAIRRCIEVAWLLFIRQEEVALTDEAKTKEIPVETMAEVAEMWEIKWKRGTSDA